jgi:hypothetical protein
MDYLPNLEKDILENAWGFVEEYLDEIVADIKDDGYIAGSLYDFPDSDTYVDENFGEMSFNAHESVEIIRRLSQYLETDTAYWDEQDPLDPICTQATFTFRNACINRTEDLLDEINHLAESRSSRDNIKGILLKRIKDAKDR